MADVLADAVLGVGSTPPRYRIGTVQTLSPLVVLVDGVACPAIDVTDTPLPVGAQVLTQTLDGTVWFTHDLTKRPMLGTVSAITSGTVTVETTAGALTSVPVAAGTATLGATVTILWGSQGAVVLAGGSTAAPAPPPTPPKQAETDTGDTPRLTPGDMDKERWERATIDARATAACTSRDGSYRSDGNAPRRAYQGRYSGGSSQDNRGWFFYGSQLRRAGTSECLSCTVRLTRPRQAGTASKVGFVLRLHGQQKKGSSPPSLVGSLTKTANLAWGDTLTVNLGTEIGQAFLDGTARGLALVYSGTSQYGALLGPSESALAGRIVIKYRRKVS